MGMMLRMTFIANINRKVIGVSLQRIQKKKLKVDKFDGR